MNKKILVVLDGSEEAECVLPYTKALAIGFKPPAKLILYSAIEGIASSIEEYLLVDKVYPERKRQYEDALLTYLRNIASDLQREGVNVEEATAVALATDDVAEGILQFAEQNGVDAIILNTHGKSGKSRRPFGSVAHSILERSSVPVFVVPVPGYR
jgi:nucleotide-binding universal stress UspA family protein